MNNPSDFVIENGVLKKYKGPGGDVLIPEGVTSVGRSAFYRCNCLTSVMIPERVTKIGDWAFRDCSSMTSVTIPTGVTSIGNSAFEGCSKLSSVTIPESVTSIGVSAFNRCSKLTSVTIPAGITSIGAWAFSSCESLKRVSLPASLKKIEMDAFRFCSALECIELASADVSFENDPFEFCWNLRILLPEGAVHTDKRLSVQLSRICRELNEEDLAWVLLFQTAKVWRDRALSEASKKNFTAIFQKQLEIARNQKRLLSAAASNAVDSCLRFSPALSATSIKELAAILREKKCEKQLATLAADLTVREKLLGDEASAELEDIEQIIKKAMDNESVTQKTLEDRLHGMGVKSEDFPPLKDKNGKVCKPLVLLWLLTAHEKIENYSEFKVAYKKPGIKPAAAEVAAWLEPESLQQAIKYLADRFLQAYENTKKKYLTYPFCRYADETNMAELTRRAPSWATSVSGKDAPPLLQLRDAVKYSNTRAAMLFAERYGDLDEYAKLRGMTEDEIRDKYLSDVGLDEQGGRVYDLGNQTVTVRLQKDLSFLFELPEGKTAKSLPKKNADPAKYETAKADFDEMRKSVKKIVKSRADKLFRDFLVGKERPAKEWKEAYLKNPLLRGVAELVVWDQDGNTFILSNGKPVDCSGQPYEITDIPIKIAHPMEMKKEKVKTWQKYFTQHGLKQPFLQIWEPLIDPNTIREDRYEGSVQPMYRFSGKDKHGIHSGNLHAYSEDIGFSLDDCELDYEASTWRVNWTADNATYTLGKFSFGTFTRKVNHIVSLLDKWTVEDRVKKDDVSTMDLMDAFTLAQITEFIKLAQEANAVNVLTLLLNYKNNHFADFDPMEEFTLE